MERGKWRAVSAESPLSLDLEKALFRGDGSDADANTERRGYGGVVSCVALCTTSSLYSDRYHANSFYFNVVRTRVNVDVLYVERDWPRHGMTINSFFFSPAPNLAAGISARDSPTSC